MKIIEAWSPDQALRLGFEYLGTQGKLNESRAGSVTVSDCPVTTIFSYPSNKVLFSPLRDANPFFHMLEALWMLNGEDDAAFLNNYVSSFGPRFAESDGHRSWLHGAYGYRWRKAFGFDQLYAIVEKLSANPDDRQAVLQMWDCNSEAFDGCNDLLGMWKDRPCNTHIYFRVNDDKLDMTVCCRSNDMIWGAYGANLVHFGFLMEYVSACLGVKVGRYYQLSNNFHAYTEEVKRLTDKIEGPKHYNPLLAVAEHMSSEQPRLKLVPIGTRSFVYLESLTPIQRAHHFNKQIKETFDMIVNLNKMPQVTPKTLPISFWRGNSNFSLSLIAAAMTHKNYKARNEALALEWVELIKWPDWKMACSMWLNRRRNHE
jgi:thymidylate synthase